MDRLLSIPPTAKPTARQPAQKGSLQQRYRSLTWRQTAKIHALTDEIGRPYALLITAGNVHDATGLRPKTSSPTEPMMPEACARNSHSGGSKRPSHRIRPASIPAALRQNRTHVLPPQGLQAHRDPHDKRADNSPENPLAPDLQADMSADQLLISTVPAV